MDTGMVVTLYAHVFICQNVSTLITSTFENDILLMNLGRYSVGLLDHVGIMRKMLGQLQPDLIRLAGDLKFISIKNR